MKPDYNYHTHTYRCRHAAGSDEDYVKSAILEGIKVLGFSDHLFIPGIRDRFSRGNYSELDGYIASINALKEKYKDDIEIHLGFEAEYTPSLEYYYRELLENKGIEYLILGQHCRFNTKLHTTLYYLQYLSNKGMLRYKDDLIAGMRSGFFKYVAHPDYFASRIRPGSELFDSISNEILSAAQELDIPLEINLGHHQIGTDEATNRHYATRRFFELAGKYEVRVILGSDAHDPNAFSKTNYDFAYDMINEFGLTEVKRIDL